MHIYELKSFLGGVPSWRASLGEFSRVVRFLAFVVVSGGLLIGGATLEVVAATAPATAAKQEVAAPVSPLSNEAAGGGGDAVELPKNVATELPLAEWQNKDWLLLKPKPSLVELDGYFRVRTDILRHLTLGHNVKWEERARYSDDGGADFFSTNMRLRIEPTLHITNDMQIVSTLDLLDNLVWGSTPDTVYLAHGTTPVNVLSRVQTPPRQGDNALQDSLVVKRLYAKINALNDQLELRVGRMPDHWGTGMFINSGDCLDCDYGHIADRLALTFKVADHLFSPMIDWISSGVLTTPFGRHGGQAFDAFGWDNAFSYGLRVSRVDHPQDILKELEQGNTVLNYGFLTAYRVQPRDLVNRYYAADTTYDPAPVLTKDSWERRDAWLFTGDAYAEFYADKLKLSAESVLEVGAFKDSAIDNTLQLTKVKKYGGALTALYTFKKDEKGTSLSLKTGAASGDRKGGFGALDQADTQRGVLPNNVRDYRLENFQFSPDYHIDVLLFRRMLGTVTDAWYLKPEIAYMFNDRVRGSFAVIYSQAMRKESTPSCQSSKPALPLGLEFDAELSYGLLSNFSKFNNVAFKERRVQAKTEFPLRAALAFGGLFPLAAFKNAANENPSFVWGLQGKLYLVF